MGEIIRLVLDEGLTVRAALKRTETSGRRFAKMREDSSLLVMYEAAMKTRAEFLAEEGLEIVDTEPDPNRAKVRAEYRKWLAGCTAPKRYGPKIEMDVKGDIDIGATLAMAHARVNALGPIYEMETVDEEDDGMGILS